MAFPQTQLGRTGLTVSRIGLGGLVLTSTDPAGAAHLIADSVEQGINYFDVSPTYGDAELILGPALKPFRNDVTIACKTICRDRNGARHELHNSLKRLETDHLDLYQLHALNDIEKDIKAAFAPDGAMSTIIEARDAGLIHHIGFSAHTPHAALAALAEFDFDTVMFPVNFCTHFNSNMETDVITEAKKRNMGIIALKALALQKLPDKQAPKPHPGCWYQPIDEKPLARLALSWTYDQGVTVALSPADVGLFQLCLELAPHCTKLTNAELQQLKELAHQLNPIFPK